MNNLIKGAGLISVMALVMPFAVFAQNAPADDAAGTVTGTATYRERIPMPKNAVFEATLVDVSKMDAPAEVIGTAVTESPGNPPYHFAIAYDPRRIVENHTYAVRATIKIGDQLAFTSETVYPVITNGHGKEVNIVLQSARIGMTTSESVQSHKGTPLENTTWKLTRLGEKEVTARESQRAPYIVLQSADHRVAGSGGCNRLSGTYRVEKQTIHFGPIATTMMACATGMDTEKEFMQALDAARKWKIQDGALELSGEDGNSLARFQPAG